MEIQDGTTVRPSDNGAALLSHDDLVSLNASIEERNLALEAVIVDLRDRLADAKREIQTHETAMAPTFNSMRQAKDRVIELENDRDHQRELATAAQRKLDRALGYIDRIVDVGQMHTDRDGAPVMPATIGPDLASVPTPYRRMSGPAEGIHPWGAGVTELKSAEYPSRRY